MRGFGLGPRDMSSSASSSLPSLASWIKSGNLNVVGTALSDEERRRSCPVVACGTILGGVQGLRVTVTCCQDGEEGEPKISMSTPEKYEEL